MAARLNMRSCLSGMILCAVIVFMSGSQFTAALAAPENSAPSSASETNFSAVEESTTALPDGIYLILRQADERHKLDPLAATERAIINDYHFLEKSERGEPHYVVVSTESFIPMLLSDAVKETDANGRPKLLLAFADDQVAPIEEFTRKNVEKSIAIVIGGQVVSTHKIREPIAGGKVQITRCTDNGCAVLYSELKQKAATKKEARAKQ